MITVELTTVLVEAAIGIGVGGILYGVFAVYSKVKDLWDWHNKEDEEGVKIWYTRNAKMEDTLEKMTDILDRLDRRDERASLIQNHQIDVLEKHTETINKLTAVVEALTVVARRNGK